MHGSDDPQISAFPCNFKAAFMRSKHAACASV